MGSPTSSLNPTLEGDTSPQEAPSQYQGTWVRSDVCHSLVSLTLGKLGKCCSNGILPNSVSTPPPSSKRTLCGNYFRRYILYPTVEKSQLQVCPSVKKEKRKKRKGKARALRVFACAV